MKIYDDLFVFYVLARSSTLSNAARKLNTNQSSVSTTLLRLEKNIGKKLLIRKRNGLELTSAGRDIFLSIAPSYVSLNEKLSELLGEEPTSFGEEIKVLTTTGALASIIVDVIEEFHRDFPNTVINLQTYDGPVDFLSMQADVGILPSVKFDEMLHKKRLFAMKSKMFCSRSYLEKYGTPKTLEDLTQHKFIGYYNAITGYKGDVDWHLAYSANGEADIKINLASSNLRAATKGLGIVALPDIMPGVEALVPVFPEQYVSIDVFAISIRDQRNKMVDNFIEYVKKIASSQEGLP